VRTEYKGDVDLVTEADRASEALIGSGCARRFRIMESTAKRERAKASNASSAGTSIRSTGRPTLRTAFRSSA
jgi:hypothetical protein